MSELMGYPLYQPQDAQSNQLHFLAYQSNPGIYLQRLLAASQLPLALQPMEHLCLQPLVAFIQAPLASQPNIGRYQRLTPLALQPMNALYISSLRAPSQEPQIVQPKESDEGINQQPNVAPAQAAVTNTGPDLERYRKAVSALLGTKLDDAEIRFEAPNTYYLTLDSEQDEKVPYHFLRWKDSKKTIEITSFQRAKKLIERRAGRIERGLPALETRPVGLRGLLYMRMKKVAASKSSCHRFSLASINLQESSPEKTTWILKKSRR